MPSPLSPRILHRCRHPKADALEPVVDQVYKQVMRSLANSYAKPPFPCVSRRTDGLSEIAESGNYTSGQGSLPR